MKLRLSVMRLSWDGYKADDDMTCPASFPGRHQKPVIMVSIARLIQSHAVFCGPLSIHADITTVYHPQIFVRWCTSGPSQG